MMRDEIEPAPIAATQLSQSGAPLLDVNRLNVYFRTPSGEVRAIQDLAFRLWPGEIAGLVGESGSGKSVTGLALIGLLPERSSRVTGEALFNGRDLISAKQAELSAIRGNDIGIIFQDPLTALDPVFTIERQVVEIVRAHEKISRVDARKRALKLLDDVGLPRAAERLKAYPHELSGGMQQRVMIAIALACNPQLLIADEPTTALDVTIQAQILDLLRSLSRERGTTVLLISHDLGVIAEVCSRVMTMYAGEVIEQCSVDDALDSPLHPYTSGLMEALPRPGAGRRRLRSIPGRVPSLDDMPEGCHFAPRCRYTQDRCAAEHPALRLVEPTRAVRCVRAEELHLPGSVEAMAAPTTQGVSDT
jgi:peptide/nickel transport system ATP-binding protein